MRTYITIMRARNNSLCFGDNIVILWSSSPTVREHSNSELEKEYLNQDWGIIFLVCFSFLLVWLFSWICFGGPSKIYKGFPTWLTITFSLHFYFFSSTLLPHSTTFTWVRCGSNKLKSYALNPYFRDLMLSGFISDFVLVIQSNSLWWSIQSQVICRQRGTFTMDVRSLGSSSLATKESSIFMLVRCIHNNEREREFSLNRKNEKLRGKFILLTSLSIA